MKLIKNKKIPTKTTIGPVGNPIVFAIKIPPTVETIPNNIER